MLFSFRWVFGQLVGWFFVLFFRQGHLKSRLAEEECELLILLPLPPNTVITAMCQPPCLAKFLVSVISRLVVHYKD